MAVYIPLVASLTDSTAQQITLYNCKYNLALSKLDAFVSTEKHLNLSAFKSLIVRYYTDPTGDKPLLKFDKLVIAVAHPIVSEHDMLERACREVVAKRPPPPEVIIAQAAPVVPVPVMPPPPVPKKKIVPVQLSTAQAEQNRIEQRVPNFSDDVLKTDLILAYIRAFVNRPKGMNDDEVRLLLAERVKAAGVDTAAAPITPGTVSTRKPLLLKLSQATSILNRPKPGDSTYKKRKVPTDDDDDDEAEEEEENDTTSIQEDLETYLVDVVSLGISPRIRKDTLKFVAGTGMLAASDMPENMFIGILPALPCSEGAAALSGPFAVQLVVGGVTFVNPDPNARTFSFMRESKLSPLLRLGFSDDAARANVWAVPTTQEQLAIITLRAIAKDEPIVIARNQQGPRSFFDRINGRMFSHVGGAWQTVIIDTWANGIPSFSERHTTAKDLMIPDEMTLDIDPDLKTLPQSKNGKISIVDLIKALQGGARWQQFKRVFNRESVGQELEMILTDGYVMAEMQRVLLKPAEHLLLHACQRELSLLIRNERERIKIPGEFPFFSDDVKFARMTLVRERCIEQKQRSIDIKQLAEGKDAISAHFDARLEKLRGILARPDDPALDAILQRRQQELAAEQTEAYYKRLIADENTITSAVADITSAERIFQLAYENRDNDEGEEEEETLKKRTIDSLNKDLDDNKLGKWLLLVEPKLNRLGLNHDTLMAKYGFYNEFFTALVGMTSGELSTYYAREVSIDSYRQFYASELLLSADLGRWTDNNTFETEQSDLLAYVKVILETNMSKWTKDIPAVGQPAREDDVYLSLPAAQQVRNLVAYRAGCINWFKATLAKGDDPHAAGEGALALLDAKRLKLIGIGAPIDLDKELESLNETQLTTVRTALDALPPIAGPSRKKNTFEPDANDTRTVAAVKVLMRFLQRKKNAEDEKRVGTFAARKEAAELDAFNKLDEEGKYAEFHKTLLADQRKQPEERKKLNADMVLAVLNEEDRANFETYEELWDTYREKKEAVRSFERKKAKTKKDEDEYADSMQLFEVDYAKLRGEGFYLEQEDLDDPISFPQPRNEEEEERFANQIRLDIALHYYRFRARKAVREADVGKMLTMEEMWALLESPARTVEEEEERLPNYPSAALFASEHDDNFMLQVFCRRDLITNTYSSMIHAAKLGLVVRDVPTMHPPNRGIFTTRTLPFALCLGIYGGTVLTQHEYNTRYPPGSNERKVYGLYVFKLDNSKAYAKEQLYIDGRPQTDMFSNPTANIMSYINDYRGLDTPDRPGPNIEFIEVLDVPAIKVITLRDIGPGEQLLGDYGSDDFEEERLIGDKKGKKKEQRSTAPARPYALPRPPSGGESSSGKKNTIIYDMDTGT